MVSEVKLSNTESSHFDRSQNNSNVYIPLQTELIRKKANDIWKGRCLLRIFPDKAPIGITVINQDCRFIYVNSTFCNILGYTPSELYEMSVFDVSHPDDIKKSHDRLELAEQVPECYPEMEKKYIRKNGEIIWGLTSLSWIYDDDKTPILRLAFVQDITFRKKNEIALREKEKRYRALFEQSNDAVLLHSLDGNIFEINDRALKLMKYSRDNIVNKNIKSLITNEEFSKFDNAFKQTLKEGHVRFDSKIIRNDDSKIDVNISSGIIDTEEGIVQSIIRDITDWKKTKFKILQMNEYMKNILDSASEIIISLDNSKRIEIWNKQIEQLTGYNQTEMKGDSIFHKKVFEQPDLFLDAVNRIKKGEDPNSDEFILKTKKNKRLIIRGSFSIIKNTDGIVIGILFIGRDITEKREVHGKLIPGHSYLITDKEHDFNTILDIFTDLIESGSKGLYITRSNNNNIQSRFSKNNVDTYYFNKNNFKESNSISELLFCVNQFCLQNNKSVIYLGRVDYLINHFSFKTFINTLYEINDIIVETNSILLVYINSNVFNQYEYSMISEELDPLPSQRIEDVQLKEKLYSVLTYIDDQNRNNKLVSFKKIGKKFSIVNLTVARRVDELEQLGLIYIKKMGRSKSIFITEKGQRILNKKQTI